jgi:hypothetical protein
VRDIAIQEREEDLVLGTFGRGFYILDDYSSLRQLRTLENKEAELLPIRDALLFEYRYPLGLPGKAFQGDDYYLGENLGSEAIFTYFLKEEIRSKRDQRLEREKKTNDDPYPSYAELKNEKSEEDPYLLFTIKNNQGEVVRKLTTKPKKGINRLKWDLRTSSTDPIRLTPPSFYNPFSGPDAGTLVPPGVYTVSMSKFVDGVFTELSDPTTFDVKSLRNTVLPAADRDELAAIQQEVLEMARLVNGAQNILKEVNEEMKYIKKAIDRTPVDQKGLTLKYLSIQKKLNSIDESINGDEVAAQLDIDRPLSVAARLGNIQYAMFFSTSETTTTNLESLKIVRELFEPLRIQLRSLITDDLSSFQKDLEDAGAPYTPNRIIVH